MRFAIAVSVLMLATGQAMADPTNPNTGFAIYPALGDLFARPNSTICGKVIQKAVVRVPRGKRIESEMMIAYYRAKLPGSVRYYHSIIGGTPQDVFISGYGASEVTITPHTYDVYAISFKRFTPPLSARRVLLWATE